MILFVTLTAVRVIRPQIEEAGFAAVAALTLHVLFADTLTSQGIAQSAALRPGLVAVTCWRAGNSPLPMQLSISVSGLRETYVCKRSGLPAASVDPGRSTVDIVHTEAPSGCCGSCHTRRHSGVLWLRTGRRRNDMSLSDRDSYTLKHEAKRRRIITN